MNPNYLIYFGRLVHILNLRESAKKQTNSFSMDHYIDDKMSAAKDNSTEYNIFNTSQSYELLFSLHYLLTTTDWWFMAPYISPICIRWVKNGCFFLHFHIFRPQTALPWPGFRRPLKDLDRRDMTPQIGGGLRSRSTRSFAWRLGKLRHAWCTLTFLIQVDIDFFRQ